MGSALELRGGASSSTPPLASKSIALSLNRCLGPPRSPSMLSLLNASLSPLRFPSSTSSHDFRGSSESDLVSDDDPVDAADPQLLSRRARKSSTRIAAARLLIVGEPPNPGAVAASKPTTRSCGSEFTRRSSASRSRLLRSEDARSSISRMNTESLSPDPHARARFRRLRRARPTPFRRDVRARTLADSVPTTTRRRSCRARVESVEARRDRSARDL